MTVRVLVVDDDAAGRDLLRSAFSNHGWHVTTSTDGVAALESAHEAPPDVVVSDILMPLMDGYRLCQEWRADEILCSIPFVFYTATYTAPEDEEFALNLGADGFISKPTDPKEIIALIESIMGSQAGDSVQRRRCEERPDEAELLKGYNERLVRKLEDKLFQVERMNQELRTAIELLSEEVQVKSRLIGEVAAHHDQDPKPDWRGSVELMREIVDAAPIGIVVVDREGHTVRWNRFAELLLGLEGVEDFDAGMDQAHGDDLGRYHEVMMQMLSGESVLPTEMNRILLDGDRRTLQVAGGPLKDTASDEILGAFFVLTDITECHDSEVELAVHKKRLEHLAEQRMHELTAANERLQEASRAKSAFLAGMGHEMKNQLNSIIGFSGILQEGLAGELTEEQTRQVGMVYTAGQTLLALVNDVVDLSKLEAGQMKTNVTPFEMLGFLEGIVASLEKAAEEERASLELVAPSGVIPTHSDRVKLEQIMRNLLSNAIKFAPGGHIFVEVERSDDGESVIIRVRDTGEGIAPEVMTRIFDEFVKHNRTGSRETSGTGLGLAITRKLSEMLGGSISARSNPGEGSVFTVLIPVDLREDTTDQNV